VYDRVFIPGDRFRITRNLRYDTTTATSNNAPTGPIAPSKAVRMSACAKEPNRQTEVLHIQPR
jgi:hypothetical protein